MFSLLAIARHLLIFIFTAAIACLSLAHAAPTQTGSSQEIVSISDAWVRSTNAGQEVGAAYMTLTSAEDISLTGVSSDVSSSVEIHSMTMENGVMKMRMQKALALTAGKPYALAPGGYHLMLFDLKQALAVGEPVNFVLNFETKNKLKFSQKIKVMVQSAATDGNAHSQHQH
jgi:copper(I)-binding protein